MLSKATPTRLICRGGQWVLELTRLVAVDRDVFQPRQQCLEGPDAILAALRRSEEGQALVSGAAHLMRTRTDEDRAFEASEGDWVTSSLPPLQQRAAQARSSELEGLATLVAELRAELTVMRAAQNRLIDRVMALEAVQSGLGASPVRPARGRGSHRRSEPPPAAVLPLADGNGPVAFAATQASPGLAAAHAGDPALGSTGPDAEAPAQADGGVRLPPSVAEMVEAIGGPPLRTAVSLPGAPELNQVLAGLFNGELELAAADVVEPGELVGAHLSRLLADDGAERGGILMDARAVIALGAKLLALSEPEVQRQLAENAPSEDVVLAASEVCNNLTGAIDAASGNDHVRASALSPEISSLPEPRARRDFQVEGGRVTLMVY